MSKNKTFKIQNEPKINNEFTNGLRDICQRRASTISYMMDEAKKQGIDDSFARKAIYRYGEDLGKEICEAMDDVTDMVEFSKYFGAAPHTDIYEMETIESDENKLYIDFHYCPYVAEWVKQGRTPEELDNLCDIAMEGDRAIGDAFPKFKFTLGITIAQGHHVCEIRFDKVGDEE